MLIWIIIGLIGLKVAGQLWLEHLNRAEVKRHAGAVPEAFRQTVELPTYEKGVQYTLAKSSLAQWNLLYDMAVLLLVVFSGVLPWAFEMVREGLGSSAWSMSLYLLGVGIVLAIPGLPWDWYEQFHVEDRFGFNTMTARTWWLDRVKASLLAIVLGLPLLALILKLVDWMGAAWWLWAWGAVLLFQLVMMVLAPVLILPLFNKLTPLPEGTLRERLLDLGKRTGFHARNILVMDGSKRSRHSNAFFTGFGRFRKIVLFDTLISQLNEAELEAVLAHEIGHYKKRHIPKMLLASAVGLLVMLFFVAWLAKQEAFYRAFGFETGSIVPALLLFSLLSGVVTFWLSPLGNVISRKFEYEADAYAAGMVESGQELVSALRKLNEKNLSNLTPHKIYSAFYYSHPTLLEREQALAERAG